MSKSVAHYALRWHNKIDIELQRIDLLFDVADREQQRKDLAWWIELTEGPARLLS